LQLLLIYGTLSFPVPKRKAFNACLNVFRFYKWKTLCTDKKHSIVE